MYWTLTYNIYFITIIIIFLSNILLIHKNSKEKLDINAIQKDFKLFQKVLDKYYIDNIYYTLFACILYLSSTVFIFLVLRYSNIGSITNIPKIDITDMSTNYIIYLIIILVAIIICLILLRQYINELFYLEIIKLDLYLDTTSWRYSDTIFSFTNLLSEIEFFYNLEQICRSCIDRNHKMVLSFLLNNNYYVLAIVKRCQDLCAKSNIMLHIFMIFTKIFYLLEYNFHLVTLREVFPEILLAYIFLYELCNKQFKFLYYYLFIYLFILLYKRFIEFRRRALYESLALGEYFYRNKIPYKQQRSFILSNTEESIVYTTPQNKEIYTLFLQDHDFVTFVLSNKHPWTIKYPKQYETPRRLFLSFVVTYLAILMLIKYYIYSWIYIFILPTIIIWYILLTKFFPRESENIKDIKKRYKIALWILMILQTYICYKILICPEMFFMKSEIIWDYIITIKKTYTIEEKIKYIYEYFDHYTSRISNLTVNQIEYIRHILRQIDFTSLINENTTIENIRKYVETLPQLYIINENMILEHNQKLAEMLEKRFRTLKELKELGECKPWFTFIRRGLSIIIVGATLAITAKFSFDVLKMYVHISKLENLQILRSSILKDLLWKKVKLNNYIDMLYKLYKMSPDGKPRIFTHGILYYIKMKDFLFNVIEYFHKFFS